MPATGNGKYPREKADVTWDQVKHEAVAGLDGWCWPMAAFLIRPVMATKVDEMPKRK